MTEKALFAFILGIGLEVHSWYALALGFTYLADGKAFTNHGKWGVLNEREPKLLWWWKRCNSFIAGFIFGALGIALNVLSAHPDGFFSQTPFRYLGMALNALWFGFIMRLTWHRPEPHFFWRANVSALQQSLGRTMLRKCVVTATAAVLVGGGWLFPMR